MTGAHSRNAPLALRAIAQTVSSVATALIGAPSGGASSGTSVSMPKMIGITVTAISMITVPATVGVSTRRNRESRAENVN